MEPHNSHSTLGYHVIMEVSGCPSVLLDDLELIKQTLIESTQLAHVTVINSLFYKFPSQGVTCLLLLSESHLSLHTWPEKDYASLDFYSCGQTDPIRACHYIATKLQADKTQITKLQRGVPIRVNKEVLDQTTYYIHKAIQ